MSSVTRVNMISGPRNISTAMMYSFRSRADTTVFDEPLYAHYLHVTGIDHPGKDVTMADCPSMATRRLASIIGGVPDTVVFMIKNMAPPHRRVGLDLGWLDEVTNFFLIREPDQVITSSHQELPRPNAEHDRTARSRPSLSTTWRRRGQDPDRGELSADPRGPGGSAAYLCERLGIDWDPAMLSWEAGPKPEDGTWAVHWYARLHESTGFEPYRPKDDEVPERLHNVLAECEAAFETLEKYLA